MSEIRSGTPQIIIDFDRAASIILEAAHAIASASEFGRTVIAICGPVGAGKSTLAAQIGGTVLSTDRYLPDYHTTEPHKRDLPESADLALLTRHVDELGRGFHVEAPIWSFKSHRREGYEKLLSAPVIVIEGIHALHTSTLPLIDIPVFIDANSEIRWSRWERIERAGLRGMGVEKARQFFDSIAEPTFHAHASDYRSHARFLVKNDTGLPTF